MNNPHLLLGVAIGSGVFSLLSLIAFGIFIRIYMATPPVSQATFDNALTTLSTALNTLFTLGQTIALGLANVEAALTAAQQNPGATDFSGELATVQNLQAEIATATTSAQTLINTIPAADLPTPTPTPTPTS